MNKAGKITGVVLLMGLVAGCGSTPGQRALSGGALGAGGGALGAVILGANPVTGALVGGAVGAITGAVTKKKHINFGDL